MDALGGWGLSRLATQAGEVYLTFHETLSRHG